MATRWRRCWIGRRLAGPAAAQVWAMMFIARFAEEVDRRADALSA